MRRERQLRTCGIDVGSEMRERERKEREEILNENGREIKWMKGIWKMRERTEKERSGG
jgi:hypothetical protein